MYPTVTIRYLLVALLFAHALGQTVYLEFVYAGGCLEGEPKTEENCQDYFAGSTEVDIDTTTYDEPVAQWEFDCDINKNELPKNVTIDIPLQVRGHVDTMFSTEDEQSGRIQHIDPTPSGVVFFSGPAGVLIEDRDIIERTPDRAEYYNIQIKNFEYSSATLIIPGLEALFSCLFSLFFFYFLL